MAVLPRPRRRNDRVIDRDSEPLRNGDFRARREQSEQLVPFV